MDSEPMTGIERATAPREACREASLQRSRRANAPCRGSFRTQSVDAVNSKPHLSHPPGIVTPMPLTPTDARLVALWNASWTHTGLRDQRVTAETGLSPTRAAQRLVHLLDDPEARAAFPVELNRLERIRSQFQRSRRAG